MAAAAAAVAAALLAGCVTMPSSGLVRVDGQPSSGGPVAEGVQFVPVPPGGNWKPTEIVAGFLAASGSSLSGNFLGGNALSGNSFAVAREYLSPAYRRQWRPGRAATIIQANPRISVPAVPTILSHMASGASSTQVSVVSRFVETLQPAGNLVASSHGHQFQFELVQVDGEWRISSIAEDGTPSNNLLLLTETDFARDYQPRNLYFFPAGSPQDVLVPDPVFIPQQAAGSEGGARLLVRGLIASPRSGSGPTGWLSDATSTAFPAGTKILGVQVSGIKAVVDLGGTAARAGPGRLFRMEAQLVWSLTSAPYSPGPGAGPAATGIGSVELLLDHRRPALLLPQGFTQFFARWQPAAGPLYYQQATAAGGPGVDELRSGSAARAVPLPGGLGNGPFTAIAVSPPGLAPAILAACRGRDVYQVPLGAASRIASAQRLQGRCTSLSWDDEGDLWATAGNGAYVLAAGTPAGPGRPGFAPVFTAPGEITSLQVAPDGVRAAMIVRTPRGPQIRVAAISRNAAQVYSLQAAQMVQVGSDIADPVALGWRDPYYLLVAGQARGGADALYEVPLNGGAKIQLPTVLPAHVTQVIVSQRGTVVATDGPGEAGQRIWLQPPGSDGLWTPITTGITPDIP